MTIKKYGLGIMVLAYVALSLQFLVPHHHHQQATFLFLDKCPTATSQASDDHSIHDDHDDGDCHHPHSGNSACSALDHVVATQKKQQAFGGSLDWSMPPLLPLLYQFNLFIPLAEPERTFVNGTPLVYQYVCLAAHSLRGPPAFS